MRPRRGETPGPTGAPAENIASQAGPHPTGSFTRRQCTRTALRIVRDGLAVVESCRGAETGISPNLQSLGLKLLGIEGAARRLREELEA